MNWIGCYKIYYISIGEGGDVEMCGEPGEGTGEAECERDGLMGEDGEGEGDGLSDEDDVELLSHIFESTV